MEPTRSILREYLAIMASLVSGVGGRGGSAYVSIADFVLREGTAYEAAAYDADRWGDETLWTMPRQCFRNALTLVSWRQSELVYVEGYALHMIPVPHAWTVERATRRVVDPTWGDTPGTEYLGIPFRFEVVDEMTDARGKYGVLDDWEHDWPLLQQPIDPDLLEGDLR